MAIITSAGDALIAARQAAGQNLIIDKIIFANINGLDDSVEPPKSEGKPSAVNIVATENLTHVGRVNGNVVVYSIVMPSTMGTWSFNWMGLYSSEFDTVVAVAYTPLQEKRKTVGDVLGNVFNKNFALEFLGAADTTGAVIDAASWQIDYTARIKSMDEVQREAIKAIYGQAAFVGDGFKVGFSGSQYFIGSGRACMGGLFGELSSNMVIDPGSLPKTVWLDVYKESTMAGVNTAFEVVFNDGTDLADYVTDGVGHSLVKLAVISSQANILDQRQNVMEDFEVFHKGNSVNPLDFGLGKFTDMPEPPHNDIFSLQNSGFYAVSDDCENTPNGVGGAAICFSRHSLNTTVIFMEASSRRLYTINKGSGIWGSWAEIGTTRSTSANIRAAHMSLVNSSAALLMDGDPGEDYNQSSPGPLSRITNNDGGGNLCVRRGCYFADGADRYCETGSGASKVVLSADELDGVIQFYVAEKGVKGEVIEWKPSVRLDIANLKYNGQVVLTEDRVSNSPTDSDQSKLASIKAVKGVKDIADSKAAASHSHDSGDLPSASTTAKGVVQLSSSTSGSSTTKAATEKAVNDIGALKADKSHSHNASDLPSASTTAKGVVQLSSIINGNSTSKAATESAVKAAYDKGNHSHPYAASSHTHQISDITDLQESLDSKFDLTKSSLIFTGERNSYRINSHGVGFYRVYFKYSASSLINTGLLYYGSSYCASVIGAGVGSVVQAEVFGFDMKIVKYTSSGATILSIHRLEKLG